MSNPYFTIRQCMQVALAQIESGLTIYLNLITAFLIQITMKVIVAARLRRDQGVAATDWPFIFRGDADLFIDR